MLVHAEAQIERPAVHALSAYLQPHGLHLRSDL